MVTKSKICFRIHERYTVAWIQYLSQFEGSGKGTQNRIVDVVMIGSKSQN